MTRFPVAVLVTTLAIGYVLGAAFHSAPAAGAQAGPRIFEIRTYYAHEGKLDALHARFRNHTVRLFAKHGMTNIGYWTPHEGPLAGNTLIYILAHANRDAAKKSWDAFRADPEWQKARSESEAGGAIVSKIDSVFMQATDYSPLK
jgi:NIPSNAP